MSGSLANAAAETPRMWSQLRADAQLYRTLYKASGRNRLLPSKGKLILLVQRVCHGYLLRRQRAGWTFATLLGRVFYGVAPRLIVLIAKADVLASAEIAGGVYLSDRGYLILGPQRIGRGTLIHERVTIGMRAGEQALPVIGENVWIGPDCIIYGNITVGDGATVLPGAVLSMNLSPRAVAAGNPATIVCKEFDNSALRAQLDTDVDRQSLLS
jgi:serine acetyltransferase